MSRPCTHCGWSPAAAAFPLQFATANDETRVVELELCEGCLEEIVSEPGVSTTAADPRGAEEPEFP